MIAKSTSHQKFCAQKSNPMIFETHAWIFLNRLSKSYGRPLTLATVPVEEWRRISDMGFDFIWLMGVWKRSPGARRVALNLPELRPVFSAALKNWKEEDIPGSPYAVCGYEMDPALGASEDLARVKEILHREGLGLILDYVPNHLALDHPWTNSRPEVFLQGSEKNLLVPGLGFKSEKGRVFAFGRDPFFAPWKDTVQINFFSPEARQAAIETLKFIAAVADGVRCDMAMLALRDVFTKTWGAFLEEKPAPAKEFWSEIIQAVRASVPDFVFIAEAYWDREWDLQQLGFDFTYDKKYYDRLLHASPFDISGHLRAEKKYQEKSLRFIENHDEPRAAAYFGVEKSKAAAAAAMTVPGARLIYDGQIEGKKIQIPVHLGREPQENPDPENIAFYRALLEFASDETLQEGEWQLLEALPAGEENGSSGNLLAWAWRKDNEARIIVINYASQKSQGRIKMSGEWLKGRFLKFEDKASGQIYDRETLEIRERGLYIHLEPWKVHLFRVAMV